MNGVQTLDNEKGLKKSTPDGKSKDKKKNSGRKYANLSED